uniref:Uncharacterized protein n=1 Tax=Lotharella oceanica TaxID=641309 RepID=A0A7S2U3U4_9EUKA
MPYTHRRPIRAQHLTDWSGQPLHKRARHLISPGCTVRVGVSMVLKPKPTPTTSAPPGRTSSSPRTSEAVEYIKVVKVKDGMIWGHVLDYYRLGGWLDAWRLPVGQKIAVRADAVTEIPLSWQSKKVRKQLKNLEVSRERLGMTGMTAL